MNFISAYCIRQVVEESDGRDVIADELLSMYKSAKQSGDMSDIYNNYNFSMINQITDVTVENDRYSNTNHEGSTSSYPNSLYVNPEGPDAHRAAFYKREITVGETEGNPQYVAWAFDSDCVSVRVEVTSVDETGDEDTYVSSAPMTVDSRAYRMKPWAVVTQHFTYTAGHGSYELDCTRNAVIFSTNIPKFNDIETMHEWYNLELGYLNGTVTDDEFLSFLKENLVI